MKGFTRCERHGCLRDHINYGHGKVGEECPECNSERSVMFSKLPFEKHKGFNAPDQGRSEERAESLGSAGCPEGGE